MRYTKQDNIEAEKEEQGFSLLVTHRHPKTGLITKKDPYILRVVGETGSGEKSRYWERPAGSGNLFDNSGNPIGRWDATKPQGERFLKGAPHIEWQAPETEDQKLAKTMASQASRIQELEKELALISAENKKSAASAKVTKA